MRGHAPGQPVRPGTVTEDSVWSAAQDRRADTCSSDKEGARTCKTLGPDIKKKGRAVFRRLHSSRDMPPQCGVHTKVSEAGRSGDANNPRRSIRQEAAGAGCLRRGAGDRPPWMDPRGADSNATLGHAILARWMSRLSRQALDRRRWTRSREGSRHSAPAGGPRAGR